MSVQARPGHHSGGHFYNGTHFHNETEIYVPKPSRHTKRFNLNQQHEGHRERRPSKH